VPEVVAAELVGASVLGVADGDEATEAVKDPGVGVDDPVADDDAAEDEAETPGAEDEDPTTDGESTLPEDTLPVAVEAGAWTCPSEICVKT